MCIVCKDWELGKLTSKEALANLGEMISTAGSTGGDQVNIDHYWDIVAKVMDKEVPMEDRDEGMDKTWFEETHESED